jgi:outer membrane receptor protein involved in Fe transport
VSIRFGLTDNFSMVLLASNIFDEEPPLLGSTVGSTAFNSGNTYPSTYDAVGRRYTASARLKF